MSPSDIPWSFDGNPAHLETLRSFIPTIRRIVDAIECGSNRSVNCEFAPMRSEPFPCLLLEGRDSSVGLDKPLTILIACDADAVGRASKTGDDDSRGEAADARLTLSLVEAAAEASIKTPAHEDIDTDMLRIRVHEICDMPDRAIAMMVEQTPLGNGGLHVLAEDPGKTNPLGSDPGFLKKSGSFGISITDDAAGTRIRIAPLESYATVRRLDTFARLRLAADILERKTR